MSCPSSTNRNTEPNNTVGKKIDTDYIKKEIINSNHAFTFLFKETLYIYSKEANAMLQKLFTDEANDAFTEEIHVTIFPFSKLRGYKGETNEMQDAARWKQKL